MALEQYSGDDLSTASAGADLTGAAKKLGVLSNGLMVLAGAAAKAPFPILEGAPLGRAVTYQRNGVAKVAAGGSFPSEASLTSNAAGLAVLATTDQPAFAIARQAGAANNVVEVILRPHTAP